MKYSPTLLAATIFAMFQAGAVLNAQAIKNQLVETNAVGIYASGNDWREAPGGGHRIAIIIHFTFPFTNPAVRLYPYVITNADGTLSSKSPARTWKYFEATNSFCGLVELRNSDGDVVSLLKPEVNNTAAYPDTYNLKAALHYVTSLSGSPVPHPLIGSNPGFVFYLKDYFKLKVGEDYQLKVWPIIYKRSETNSDLCERIDLAPVIIPIKW